jgi:hypothetical protein
MSQLELSKPEPQDRFEPQNRFPDCVCMKLHSAPTQLEESASPILTPTSRSQATSSQEIALKLTIRFSKQEIKIEKARSSVWFGLKRGELKLKIENGKIPLEKMGLTAPFTVEFEQEVQREKGSGIEANLAAVSSLKGSQSNKESTKAKYKTYQFYTKGTETDPVWVFEAKTEEQILIGQLTEGRLGTVEVTAKPCNVKATFEVRGQRDLYLIESEGLLGAKNLNRNPTAMLTREFFLRFIESKLQSYLSRVEVHL